MRKRPRFVSSVTTRDAFSREPRQCPRSSLQSFTERFVDRVTMDELEWKLLEEHEPIEHVDVDGVVVSRGDRVRLRPGVGGDSFDLVLAGRIATIESIEQDYEAAAHVAVVLNDDPGRTLRLLRQRGPPSLFPT